MNTIMFILIIAFALFISSGLCSVLLHMIDFERYLNYSFNVKLGLEAGADITVNPLKGNRLLLFLIFRRLSYLLF